METASRLLPHVDEVVALGRTTEHIASARHRLGDAATVEKVDLYDWRQVNDLCARLETSPDRIQYLVNAAGAFVPKLFLDHLGVLALGDLLSRLEDAGVNHVVLNLKYGSRSAGAVLDDLGELLVRFPPHAPLTPQSTVAGNRLEPLAVER